MMRQRLYNVHALYQSSDNDDIFVAIQSRYIYMHQNTRYSIRHTSGTDRIDADGKYQVNECRRAQQQTTERRRKI